MISGPYRAGGPCSAAGLVGVRFAGSGLCGYLDRTGRTVIEPRFDGARPFGPDSTAAVRVGEEWGLIDLAGEWVVEPGHRLLKPFDDNGLAYVVGGGLGDLYTGFVNGRGELVLQGGSAMSDTFHHGLLRTGDGYARGFADPTGTLVIPQVYTWAEDFGPDGAAVALGVPDEEPAEGEEDGESWGVLRTDGRFVPVPYPEPLTDDDGWVLGFEGVSPGLARFLTRDGAVAHVDAAGREVARTETPAGDGTLLRLRDAAGAVVLEETGAPGTFTPPGAFLARDADHFLAHLRLRGGSAALDGLDAVPDLAAELLAAVPRPFRPCSLIFDSHDDPYDLTELDADDADDVCHGAMAVLADIWLSAEHQAEFAFLHDETSERFDEIESAAVERLRARFGEPLPGDRTILRSGDGERSTVWAVDGRLLLLQAYDLTGDGDVEIQLWLAVVDGD
ncbi:WG repeat-containing protein [Streptomyces sp. BE303]|uniref:WG repeat-containing protein n=1 Tax=Streptomyces sp. BE303 TaxID=3002528 RepID=UPI002E7632B9|nr:WG repeat-containing protein [Streptomyces sp. BE303]MED7947523.1 WG repeat-containing protein [Streptomyces sp. BE303]